MHSQYSPFRRIDKLPAVFDREKWQGLFLDVLGCSLCENLSDALFIYVHRLLLIIIGVPVKLFDTKVYNTN